MTVRPTRAENNRAAWYFLAPALLLITIFFFLPVGGSLLLSLTDFDIYALADVRNLRFVDNNAPTSGTAHFIQSEDGNTLALSASSFRVRASSIDIGQQQTTITNGGQNFHVTTSNQTLLMRDSTAANGNGAFELNLRNEPDVTQEVQERSHLGA